MRFQNLKRPTRVSGRSPGEYRPGRAMEQLEPRRMLSTISWSNRGSAGNDSDFFESTMGSLAAANAARAVVDAAIDAWERVIIDFNYPAPAASNTHDVNIAFGPQIHDRSALTLPVQEWAGYMVASRITLGSGPDIDGDGAGDGGGYFIDPTPHDHSEFGTSFTPGGFGFGNISNAYTAHADSGPASTGRDLYTLVVHELGHSMGLWPDPNLKFHGHVTDTGVEGYSSGATYWVFNGPSINHLVSNENAIPVPRVAHTVGHNSALQPFTFGGLTYQGANDLMLGGGIADGTRKLVPDTMRLMLQDAYAYETVNPAQFGTFYANLNSTTGVLYVFGGADESDDEITISHSGDTITVSVDLGADVPATGRLPGAGDLPAFVSEFSVDDVSEIKVNAGLGDDVITLESIPSGMVVELNGDDGDDVIVVGGGDLDTLTDGHIIVDGGTNLGPPAGDDLLIIDDFNDAGTDTYTLGSGQLDKDNFELLEYSKIDELIINGSDENSTFRVTGALPETTIWGRGGNDALEVEAISQMQLQDLRFYGQTGHDTVEVSDAAGDGDFNYLIEGNSITELGTNVINIEFVQAESLNLIGGSGVNQFELREVLSGVPVSMDGQGGDDIFNIDPLGANFSDKFLDLISIRGGGGSDGVAVLDTFDSGPDVYTINGGTISNSSWAAPIHYDNTTDNVSLRANNAANTFRIDQTVAGQTLSLLGEGGDDEFHLTLVERDIDNHLRGRVEVDGGPGADSVLINDNDDLGSDLYNLAAGFLEKPGTLFGGLQYSDDIELITLNANTADNRFLIQGAAAGTQLTVNANSGNDLFTVDSRLQLQDVILGELLLLGETGDDELVIDDSGQGGNDHYVVTATGVTKPGMGPINFSSSMERVALRANDGNNNIDVQGTTASVEVHIDAGTGQDLIHVGDGDIDSNIKGLLSIFGGGEYDVVSVDDHLDILDDDYSITSGGVFKANTGRITHEDVEEVILTANSYDNVITIEQTAADARFTLFAGAGNDEVQIGPRMQTLSGFESPVTVYGDAGADALTLFNQSQSGDFTHTVAVDFVSLADSPAGLVFHDMEDVQFLAGSGADAFDVQSIHAATHLTLASGDGDDTIDVVASDGRLSVDGGPHLFGDTLTFDDRGYAATDDGANITSDLHEFGPVDYQNIENVTILKGLADFDTDGDVDGGDFLAWQRGFGTRLGAAKRDGDADDDGDVDGKDLDFWERQFGEKKLGAATVQAALATSTAPTDLALEDDVWLTLSPGLADRAMESAVQNESWSDGQPILTDAEAPPRSAHGELRPSYRPPQSSVPNAASLESDKRANSAHEAAWQRLEVRDEFFAEVDSNGFQRLDYLAAQASMA